VAVIDHLDIDRVAAETLVERAPVVVVNAAQSISGRYPNAGPAILVEAGIPLLDAVGPAVFELSEGAVVEVDPDGVVRLDGAEVASGEWLQPEDVRKRMEAAKEDLATLRGYIQEFRPALIGVDGGADALLEVGLKPDLILGDMDSVTNQALTSGAEIVVHAYPDGRAPGKERVEALGLEPLVLPGAGTSEDMAMLLAYESDCDLIVAVGSHASMVEFLDKGRPGMASTFLTRLKVGPKLVDAKGVNRLYRQGVRRADLIVLVVAALAAMLVISLVSEPVRLVWSDLFELLQVFFNRIRSLFV
jgi:uncharacterized membrane-anchored protein